MRAEEHDTGLYKYKWLDYKHVHVVSLCQQIKTEVQEDGNYALSSSTLIAFTETGSTMSMEIEFTINKLDNIA